MMNGKGDKWRGGWTPQYADNHNKIFGDKNKMSKNDLTKEQQEELQELTNEITSEAKKVREDYNNNPSEISGSITQVHINSPELDKKKLDSNT